MYFSGIMKNLWAVLILLCSLSETGSSLRCEKVIMKEPTGNFSSPGYGLGKYPNNATCVYVIRTKKGTTVNVTMHKFELQYTNKRGKKTDYLKVIDGGIKTGKQNFYYGYIKRPFYFVTTSNRITMRFRTDATKRYVGFSGSYQVIAKGSVGGKDSKIVMKDPDKIVKKVKRNRKLINARIDYCNKNMKLCYYEPDELSRVIVTYMPLSNNGSHIVLFAAPSPKGIEAEKCQQYCKRDKNTKEYIVNCLTLRKNFPDMQFCFTCQAQVCITSVRFMG